MPPGHGTLVVSSLKHVLARLDELCQFDRHNRTLGVKQSHRHFKISSIRRRPVGAMPNPLKAQRNPVERPA
jgi:hypothetical protein